MLTDTHSHIFKEYFSDIDKVVSDAYDNGVNRIISDADDVKSCYEMLELAKKYDNIYITLGIHPEFLNEDIYELENIIKDNIDNPKFIAIGEIGLDYHYSKEEKEKQITLFRKQLELAQKYNLPVVIHSREATKDTIDILKEYDLKGVIHCFSGSLETALEYIKMGYYIGVGGVMTFKNSKIDNIIRDIPLDKIVLETDSPYLTPEPFRKYKNEPKYIKTIAEYLAELKQVNINEIENTTNNNIKDIFNI